MTTYLHYYYSNYLKEDGSYDPAEIYLADFTQKKQEILEQQLSNVINARAATVSKISSTTNMGVEEIENFLDTIEKDGDFSVAVDENDIAVTEEQIANTQGIEEAIEVLDNAPAWMEKLVQVKAKLEESLAKAVEDPTMLESYKKAVLANYLKDNNMRSASKASRMIIKDFLERNENTAYRVNKDAEKENEILSRSVKKAIAMLDAVDIALTTKNYSFIGKADVRHSKEKAGTYTTTRGTSQLAEIFSDKVDGLLRNVNASLEETTAAKALVNSFTEVAKKLDNVNSSLIKGKVIGSKNHSVDISFTEDENYKKLLEQAKRSEHSLGTKRYKGDVAITFGDKNSSAEILMTASVKSFKDISFKNAEVGKNVSIKLQDGTPLATFLKREIGMSEFEYAGTLQMLVGHAGTSSEEESYSEERLDQAWESMKELIKYRALVNSLAGYGEPENLFFIANGSAYSYATVVQRVMDGVADVSMTDRGDKSAAQGLGPRQVYQDKSQWKKPETHNFKSALSRSWYAYRDVNSILYKTKVRYSLIITGVQDMLHLL